MLQFNLLTLFPKIFDSYLNESILRRAQEDKVIKIKVHNIRDQAKDKHHLVDDKPYGGGAGMVLMAEPIIKTVSKITKGRKDPKTKIIIFSAKGRPFNQKLAYDWAKKYNNLILISGRYEGIDERVKTILKAEEVSIGPYVMTDGDVAAMAVVSAVSRLIPGVIKWESLAEESHFNLLAKEEKNQLVGQGLEYPHYTRPEVIVSGRNKYRVPKVLLSGNHAQIKNWRQKQAQK
ncbi:MAG: tRNA (guanosine(37)-N1)-methyltransferase TrmD [bacterium]